MNVVRLALRLTDVVVVRPRLYQCGPHFHCPTKLKKTSLLLDQKRESIVDVAGCWIDDGELFSNRE